MEKSNLRYDSLYKALHLKNYQVKVISIGGFVKIDVDEQSLRL